MAVALRLLAANVDSDTALVGTASMLHAVGMRAAARASSSSTASLRSDEGGSRPAKRVRRESSPETTEDKAEQEASGAADTSMDERWWAELGHPAVVLVALLCVLQLDADTATDLLLANDTRLLPLLADCCAQGVAADASPVIRACAAADALVQGSLVAHRVGNSAGVGADAAADEDSDQGSGDSAARDATADVMVALLLRLSAQVGRAAAAGQVDVDRRRLAADAAALAHAVAVREA
jgi:hypothetical protein